ncbi:hypothetical protein INT45_011344 [Circinella minor]|uniref:Uncharacterized protein n=1 Tax=Circinella minor TaxID=1195481 RepID=A0A8H7RZ01_9FUNG|nr:hypothetical protein INT45_011344 [Circinella minor]
MSDFFESFPIDHWSLDEYCKYKSKENKKKNNNQSSKQLRHEYINLLESFFKKETNRKIKSRIGRIIKECKDKQEKALQEKALQEESHQQSQEIIDIKSSNIIIGNNNLLRTSSASNSQEPFGSSSKSNSSSSQEPVVSCRSESNSSSSQDSVVSSSNRSNNNIFNNNEEDLGDVPINDGVEEVDDDEDDDPKSDLTWDYHPQRTLDYELEGEIFSDDDNGDEPLTVGSSESGSSAFGGTTNVPSFSIKTTTATTHKEQWNVESFNVIESLNKFRKISKSIVPKKASDLRLLSLNHIYLFALNKGSSIIQYMDTYGDGEIDDNGEHSENIIKKINIDLQIQDGAESDHCTDWFAAHDITLPFLVEARQSQDKVETIAAHVLYRLALNFSNGLPNVQLEDSFVHHIVSVIFESIFQSDQLLEYQWANGKLGGKRKSGDDDNNYKPDFVVFVSHRNDRYDIAVSEVKPPSNANSNNVVESDLVKIGKEMKWMINNLIKRGIENPVVCGILLQGFVLTTYKMDLLYPKIYRMIELKSITLPKSLHEVTVLKTMLQIKSITRKTALKAKKRAFQKSNGEVANSIPPALYLSHSNYTLQRSSNKKQKICNKKQAV